MKFMSLWEGQEVTRKLLETHLGKHGHIILFNNEVMIGRLDRKVNFDNSYTIKPRLYVLTKKDGSRCVFRSSDVKKCQEVKRK